MRFAVACDRVRKDEMMGRNDGSRVREDLYKFMDGMLSLSMTSPRRLAMQKRSGQLKIASRD